MKAATRLLTVPGPVGPIDVALDLPGAKGRAAGTGSAGGSVAGGTAGSTDAPASAIAVIACGGCRRTAS